MNRRAMLVLLAGSVFAGGPALAADPVDRILRELAQLGYGRVSVERTLLRRTRITAESAEAHREIILNPTTGEILRDLWIPLDRSGSEGGGLLGNSGSGSGSEDDGDDDDGDDNNDSDDNSGSGSGGKDGESGGDDGGDDAD